MAKETTATATAPTEKKKRGVAKGTKREKKFQSMVIQWPINSENFDPIGALTVLANSLGLHNSLKKGKNRAGEETGKNSLVFSTSAIVTRAKPVMTREKEKEALALFRATMRDPEKAPKLEALVDRSKKGEDTSAEVAALIGIS